ncbi:tRNA (adenosine(37)-N6)-threonylcarbamoyltransferase complex ATPase subunit type 1 TsaE [Herbaspirillum sp. B65]|uniref:tRNA (adenosine(37)-N6)-threonylcarbamoyltransferase complex ATPase subunit type 1 TsaE n=1 Tax=Herbaspirillum sp. B65 TaxID=137708 RepID=UPI00034B8D9F|nr:tRNA (adenosine(37)-N6)-threonylcarbamoyltransferase complex ATPase subunit type 1 TsaE [Herbaspirillum sp. B65]
MQRLHLHLPDEAATARLGADLAQVLAPGLAIYLHGDLGAGKTALTRALLHAAGYQGRVKSPTYTLAEPYEVLFAGRMVTVIHFDLYRMSSPEEFLDAGFREHFNENTVCIVEWPEKGATGLGHHGGVRGGGQAGVCGRVPGAALLMRTRPTSSRKLMHL